MGTRIHTQFWTDQESISEPTFKGIKQEIDRIEQKMSVYIDSSELSLVNREAYKQPVIVSPELFHLLEKALHFSKITHGAFDITFASIGHFYDYRKGIHPSSKKVDQLLPAINYHWVELNQKNLTVRFKHKNVKIDLGGIAKGYAIDQAAQQFKKRGITSAYLSAGGDTLLIGDRRGRPWMVGIKDPRNEKANAVVIPLENTALSTSGDYERYFIERGKRYHHIISPKTGHSADKVQSVSIIGPNATTTDALSTSIFVLGSKKGLALIEKLEKIDAIIIDNNRKMYYSSNLQAPSVLSPSKK